MSWPAVTGSGEPLLVTARSAEVPTVVVAVEVLFEAFDSVVVEATVATFVIVAPFGVAAFTLTTSVKPALAPAARVTRVQVTVPGLPAAGVVQPKVGPLVWVRDTKVVPAGRTSVRLTLWASEGPAFATVMV